MTFHSSEDEAVAADMRDPGRPSRLMWAYDALLSGLAIISATILAAIFVAIVYDVALRTLGFRPPIWTNSLAEYGLHYLTTLAAPWLLRHGGHVSVTSVMNYLSPAARQKLTRFSYVIGALTCVVLAYLSLDVMLSVVGYDIRSFAVPRWVIIASMPLSFLLLAVEFLRQAVTGRFETGGGEH